jgi:hypothetical protein
MQMVVALGVVSLITACCVGLALLLHSGARSWEGPVVFGVTLLTVLFYGWAIYSTVHHPLPAVGSRVPHDPVDTTDRGGAGSEGPRPSSDLGTADR